MQDLMTFFAGIEQKAIEITVSFGNGSPSPPRSCGQDVARHENRRADLSTRRTRSKPWAAKRSPFCPPGPRRGRPSCCAHSQPEWSPCWQAWSRHGGVLGGIQEPTVRAMEGRAAFLKRPVWCPPRARGRDLRHRDADRQPGADSRFMYLSPSCQYCRNGRFNNRWQNRLSR
jgi:hypothetical protein